MHFGHCQKFALLDADEDAKTVKETQELEPPPHEPGVLPKWLSEQGANVIISGGMGMRAQHFFQRFGVQVVVGAPSEDPKTVVEKWLKDELVTGKNVCDH